MLNIGRFQTTSILSLEGIKWQYYQLRLCRLSNLAQISFKILTITIKLNNQLLSHAIRLQPKLQTTTPIRTHRTLCHIWVAGMAALKAL